MRPWSRQWSGSAVQMMGRRSISTRSPARPSASRRRSRFRPTGKLLPRAFDGGAAEAAVDGAAGAGRSPKRTRMPSTAPNPSVWWRTRRTPPISRPRPSESQRSRRPGRPHHAAVGGAVAEDAVEARRQRPPRVPRRRRSTAMTSLGSPPTMRPETKRSPGRARRGRAALERPRRHRERARARRRPSPPRPSARTLREGSRKRRRTHRRTARSPLASAANVRAVRFAVAATSRPRSSPSPTRSWWSPSTAIATRSRCSRDPIWSSITSRAPERVRWSGTCTSAACRTCSPAWRQPSSTSVAAATPFCTPAR